MSTKIIPLLLIIILFLLPFNSRSQEKVVIKGVQTTITHNKLERVDKAIQGFIRKTFFPREDKLENPIQTKTIQTFKITYTTSSMRVDGDVKEFERIKLIDEWRPKEESLGKAAVIFNFDASEELKMSIFQPNKSTGKLKKTATFPVPKENTFTYTTTKILGVNLTTDGASGKDWNGHETIVYSFDGEIDIRDPNAKYHDDEFSLHRRDKSTVHLAQNVDGLEILRVFYNNLLEGGYDLGGADQGSLLSEMGNLLEKGMPVFIKENKDFWTLEMNQEGQDNVDYLFNIDSETKVNSVQLLQMSEAEKAAFISDDGELSRTENSSKKSKPKGCDCSCEKYKELMALSNKKKKDIDPNNMPQIDMKCMQKCAMDWSKCQRK